MSIKKAVVAGHICLDITPVFPEDSGKTDIGELLRPGRLIHVDRPDIHTGGAVANTGLAMKIMGADVRLFGKTGKDEFGMMVRSALDRYDAGADLIQDTGCATSYSIVLSPPGVDRIFLHCPGANDTFCSADIPDDIIKDAALFHFGYPALMKKMYQDNGKEMTEMFRHVSDMGIATSLDLAAAMCGITDIVHGRTPQVDDCDLTHLAPFCNGPMERQPAPWWSARIAWWVRGAM